MIHLFWKTLCKFFIKSNMHLPYHPAIKCQGIHPSEMKTYHTKTHKVTRNIYSDFIHNHQNLETSLMSFSWLAEAQGKRI